MTSTTSVASTPDLIEIEELPTGWETAKVTYRTKKGEIKASIQIIDTRSVPPIQYWHDSMRSISIKCALLVMAIPFFAIANMTFNLVCTTALVIGTLGRSFCFGINPRNWGVVDRICVECFHETIEIIAQGGCDFIRLPFLALKMQLCCLYGIFSPLQGRLRVGETERELKGSSSPKDLMHAIAMRKKDLRSYPDTIGALVDLFTNKNSEYRLYWAFCFQPVGLAIVQDPVLRMDWLKPGLLPR